MGAGDSKSGGELSERRDKTGGKIEPMRSELIGLDHEIRSVASALHCQGEEERAHKTFTDHIELRHNTLTDTLHEMIISWKLFASRRQKLALLVSLGESERLARRDWCQNKVNDHYV